MVKQSGPPTFFLTLHLLKEIRVFLRKFYTIDVFRDTPKLALIHQKIRFLLKRRHWPAKGDHSFRY